MTTGKVSPQLAAGKGMGLPGGRGSPIERRDRDGGQAALASPIFVGGNAVVSAGISEDAHACPLNADGAPRRRRWGRLRETNPTAATLRLSPSAGSSASSCDGRPSCRARLPARPRCGSGSRPRPERRPGALARSRHRGRCCKRALLWTRIPGTRSSCHYGQPGASWSSIRKTGGLACGAMNVA
jgi:hypothetical protein